MAAWHGSERTTPREELTTPVGAVPSQEEVYETPQ